MIMETSKNYYESVMRDFGMYARGRSLEQYCRDEAVDFKWLTKAMEQYGVPEEDRKPRQKRRAAVRTADKTPEMIRLHYDPEAEIAATPATRCGTAVDADTPTDDGDTLSNVQEPKWSVLSLVIKSPSGNEIELRASKISAVSELLLKLVDHA